jgi:hypothetical protein
MNGNMAHVPFFTRRTHWTKAVVTIQATSDGRVAAEAGSWVRACIERDAGEIRATRIGAPVVWFDGGGKKSNVVAVTLFDGTLGAFVIGWNKVRRIANAVRAVSTAIEGTKELAEPTTLGASGQRHC